MTYYLSLEEGLEKIRFDPSAFPMLSAAVGRLLGFKDRTTFFKALVKSGLKKPGYSLYSQGEVEEIWIAFSGSLKARQIRSMKAGEVPKSSRYRWMDNIPADEMANIRLCASRMQMGIGQFFRYCAEKVMDEEGRSMRIPELLP